MGTGQRTAIETIYDQIAEWKDDNYETDGLAVFMSPESLSELRHDENLISAPTSNNQEPLATKVAGRPVIEDRGVEDIRVLPENIDDLPYDDPFFETPPNQYLDQLLQAHDVTLDRGGDIPIASTRIPFELLGERVQIEDEVRGNSRYTGVPAPSDVTYDRGETCYYVDMAISGPAATAHNTTGLFKQHIRETINETLQEPIYATKHYTIRTMTGREIHRTEEVRVGTHERDIGRVYCTPYDLTKAALG